MNHNKLTSGDRSCSIFGKYHVETNIRPNSFKSPNYFLALHVPLWNRHNERRLLRFGFDVLKSWENFKMQVKNKATVDAPWVCYIHTHYHLIAIGVSVHQWNYRCSGLLYLSAWAATLLASTYRALPTSLKMLSERQFRASRFFYVRIPILDKHLRLSESLTVDRKRWYYEYKVF